MESIDTELFWISMMQGQTAQEYVERGLELRDKVNRNFQNDNND